MIDPSIVKYNQQLPYTPVSGNDLTMVPSSTGQWFRVEDVNNLIKTLDKAENAFLKLKQILNQEK